MSSWHGRWTASKALTVASELPAAREGWKSVLSINTFSLEERDLNQLICSRQVSVFFYQHSLQEESIMTMDGTSITAYVGYLSSS